MIAPPKPELVTVNIDGREIAVPKGTNVIEAARLVGVDVPHYCYHPKLAIVGNCRMCLVEMGTPALDPATKAPIMDPATGRQKINWIPRPQIGCATNATPGLHIRTNTPQIKDCREGVMEFLLINHPLDCPICDQAGECKLQEQSTGYGRGYSRYIEQKNVKPKRTLLGPRVVLDDERCILCSRCIRFSKDVAKDDVLGFIDRGSYSTLTCYPGRKLEHNYSLNTVDICPVGALTSTDFRFKMRVWFLKQTDSIDAESSAGANTVVWSREGAIYRITPRRNDEVNDTWMADSGRELYKQVTSADRLTEIRADGVATLPDAALTRAAELLQSGPVAVVGSGRSSVEEQYLTRRLAEAAKARTFLVTRVGEGDGLLVSADRNPNTRGALVTGFITSLPSLSRSPAGDGRDLSGAGTSRNSPAVPATTFAAATSAPGPAVPVAAPTLSATSRQNPVGEVATPSPAAPAAGYTTSGLQELAQAIDAGQVKIVVSIGEDLLAGGLSPAQLAKVAVIYVGTHANATSAAARVTFPGLTVFEKNGTFINQQFRLQKFLKAVPGPAGVADDLVTLSKLAAAAGAGGLPSDLGALWTTMAAAIPALRLSTFANLPDTGLLLDATPWAAVGFPEGEGLHFKPQSAPANA